MRALDVLVVAGFDYPDKANKGFKFEIQQSGWLSYVKVVTSGIGLNLRSIALQAVKFANADAVQRIAIVADPAHLTALPKNDYRYLDVLLAAGCPVKWPDPVVNLALKAGKAGMHADDALEAWKAPGCYVFERTGDKCAAALTKHVADFVKLGDQFDLTPRAFVMPARFSQPVITGFPIGNFNTYVVTSDFRKTIYEAIDALIVQRWKAIKLSQSPYTLAGFQLPDGMPGGNVLNYMGVPWWLWGLGGAAAVAAAWWLADKAGK